MSIYQKQHYEDVAYILGGIRHTWQPDIRFDGFTNLVWRKTVERFADTFAADNPRKCSRCWLTEGALDPCRTFNKKHNFVDSFDREAFLKACGLGTEE